MVPWIILPAAPLDPEDTVFELDSAQTEITFTLDETVHGNLELKRGTIRIDPETRWAGGEIVIDTTGIACATADSAYGSGNRLLASNKHLETVFIPNRVEGVVAPNGQSQIDLHGFLLYEGDVQEINLHFYVHITDLQITATTHFTVPGARWQGRSPRNNQHHLDVEIHASGRAAFKRDTRMGRRDNIPQESGIRR